MRQQDSAEQQARRRYEAAIAEFDRLWENGQSRRQPETMRRLLARIEAFERAQAQPAPFKN